MRVIHNISSVIICFPISGGLFEVAAVETFFELESVKWTSSENVSTTLCKYRITPIFFFKMTTTNSSSESI